MRAIGRVLAIVALSALSAGQAGGQVVERHLPPAPAGDPARIAAQAPPAEADDRPIGVRLAGIALLSPDEAVASIPARGVRIGELAPPRRAALVRSLTPFFDRPLSRKRIADIVATVIRSYRHAGRPFVSVTTPEQELTRGTLSLRVIEFSAERLAVRAPSDEVARRVAGRIRFRPGEQIDARALQQDLTWLDRYPFRRTGTVFAAGAGRGATDLTVTVTSLRPWQVFGGVGSSDAPSSGNWRAYAGAIVGGLIGPDSVVSAQATTSGFDDPGYVSVAARVVKPLGPRRELSLVTGYVQGDMTVPPFSSRTRTAQALLDYRFVLPPALIGDGHVGVEFGHQWLDGRFGGAPIYHVGATTLALVAGYGVAVPIRGGAVSADVTLHVSPGGAGGGNTADALFFGRPGGGSPTYAYLTADVSIEQAVARTFVWRPRLLLQASAAPLPALDQIGLGGSAYVRGYTLDDGGYDAAIIVRNTLVLRRGIARLFPYAFTDWGTGRYIGRPHVTFGSVGLGADHTLGHGLGVHVEAALPVRDGLRTTAMTPHLFAGLNVAL